MTWTEMDKLVWLNELTLAFEAAGEAVPVYVSFSASYLTLSDIPDGPRRSSEYSHFAVLDNGVISHYTPTVPLERDCLREGSLSELCASAAQDWKEYRRGRDAGV